MKYLIQHRKEFAISIGLFVMAVINFVRAIKSSEPLTQELIVAVLYTLFGVLAWFYNMPTSEENSVKTGEMRMMKAGTYADDEMQGIGDEDPFDEEEGDDDDDI